MVNCLCVAHAHVFVGCSNLSPHPVWDSPPPRVAHVAEEPVVARRPAVPTPVMGKYSLHVPHPLRLERLHVPGVVRLVFPQVLCGRGVHTRSGSELGIACSRHSALLSPFRLMTFAVSWWRRRRAVPFELRHEQSALRRHPIAFDDGHAYRTPSPYDPAALFPRLLLLQLVQRVPRSSRFPLRPAPLSALTLTSNTASRRRCRGHRRCRFRGLRSWRQSPCRGRCPRQRARRVMG